jgi:hypothetical protein
MKYINNCNAVVRTVKLYTNNNKGDNLPGSIPKRSFENLRPVANRTNPKSPTLIGKLMMQQSTLDQLAKEMRGSNRTEIQCNLAGWYNADHIGKCIGIEISPPYKRPQVPQSLEEFFEEPTQPEE